MIDVCLLGTGGMMPLPYRYLTSLMLRYNGVSVLIDCGEGTQIAMKEKGWSPNPIGVICFTHFHADHISGLPGMLLTMGNADRKEPLVMIGPKGLERVVQSLRVIAPELPFEIQFIELSEINHTIEMDGFKIEAFRVSHNVVCYGYNLVVERKGKFLVEKAKELGIDVRYWNKLQNGEDVVVEDVVYTSDQVLGLPRKGLKVTYCTDSRPVQIIAEFAKEADLFVCEGMYAEVEKFEKAKKNKHMTFPEAAQLASEAKAKELWLTHFSPSLTWPESYVKQVKGIFDNVIAAKDGQTIELDFDKE